MPANKKVVAAVGAAVSAYLEAEEAEQKAALARPVPKPASRPWAQAGRQEIMRNRQLWQLRIVPK